MTPPAYTLENLEAFGLSLLSQWMETRKIAKRDLRAFSMLAWKIAKNIGAPRVMIADPTGKKTRRAYPHGVLQIAESRLQPKLPWD